MWWKKRRQRLSKLLRQRFYVGIIIIIYISHEKTNELQIKSTSQMAKKWMRLKMFQLTHTYRELLTSCWSICNNWSYVDSLGLNACKWVVWKTGMNLFLWCGLVLFRLDETTNIDIDLSIWETLVIMKWFHLTCCVKEKAYTLCMHISLYIYNEAFRLILSVAFLYLED